MSEKPVLLRERVTQVLEDFDRLLKTMQAGNEAVLSVLRAGEKPIDRGVAIQVVAWLEYSKAITDATDAHAGGSRLTDIGQPIVKQLLAEEPANTNAPVLQ